MQDIPFKLARKWLPPFGQQWLLIALSLILPIFVGLYHDLFRAYWTTSDQDVPVMFQAIALNSHRSQIEFSHSGYILYVLLAWWLKLLHTIGALAIIDVPGVLGAAKPEHVFSSIIVAGRIFSMLLAAAFVFLMWLTARRIAGNTNRIHTAMLAGVFAVSPGLVHHTPIIRTELLSSFCIMLSFYLLIVAGDRPDRHKTNWPLFFAGLAATLAMMTKVQAIFGLLLFPVLLVMLPSHNRQAIRKTVITPLEEDRLFHHITANVLFGSFSLLMVFFYVMPASALPGLYQAGTIIYFGLGTLIYAKVHRISLPDWVVGASFLFAGIAAGIYTNFLYFQDQNLLAISNYIDWMRTYSSLSASGSETTAYSGTATLLLQQGRLLLVNQLDWHQVMAQPHMILRWILMAGAIALAPRNLRHAGMILMLIVSSLLLEAVFSFRYMTPRYLIYIEPWLFIGLMLVLGKVTRWGTIVTWILGGTIAVLFYMATINEVVQNQGLRNLCEMTKDYDLYAMTKKHCQ